MIDPSSAEQIAYDEIVEVGFAKIKRRIAELKAELERLKTDRDCAIEANRMSRDRAWKAELEVERLNAARLEEVKIRANLQETVSEFRIEIERLKTKISEES